VIAKIGGRSERVRLIGVDTPESVKPNTPVQCYAEEASKFTASLLPAGTAVRLVRDVESRDIYGRLLAYIYRVSDGLFVNQELAEQGYARVLTIAPNVAHEADFVAAARDARNASRGLWAQCEQASSPAR
jgi:micrococcal nuclease